MVLFVLMVGIFQDKRSPTDSALGKNHFQFRKAQQNPGKQEVHEVKDGAGRPRYRLQCSRQLRRQSRSRGKLEIA